jgi:hypothetical protein
MGNLADTQRAVADLDWRLQDVVIVPVTELPAEVSSGQ